MTNRLALGTIIDRNDLVEEYGVSMAPVRDALTHLTIEGFIVTKPYSGICLSLTPGQLIHTVFRIYNYYMTAKSNGAVNA